jgi:hypothetical protein
MWQSVSKIGSGPRGCGSRWTGVCGVWETTRFIVDQVHHPFLLSRSMCTKCMDQRSSSSSPFPAPWSCSRARHRRYGGCGPAFQGLPSPFFLSAGFLPPRQSCHDPSTHYFRLESKGMTSPWSCSGHGGHALSVFKKAMFPSSYSSARLCRSSCTCTFMRVDVDDVQASALILPGAGTVVAVPT